MACAQHLLTETEVAEFHPKGFFSIAGKRMHLFNECQEVLQTASSWKKVQAVVTNS